MKAKLIVIVAVVLACGCAFWIAIFSWLFSSPDKPVTGRVGMHAGPTAEKSTAPDGQSVTAPAKLAGVPANTITQAAKAAWVLREASIAFEQGIRVEKDHGKAAVLKSQADGIDKLIDEIERQPVTGKPEDAAKKLPSLRTLRDVAHLDDPMMLQEIAKVHER